MDISKYLKQTAVLWTIDSANGYGELAFYTPEEISVRWEERNEVFVSVDGNNLTSKAVIHTNQDIVPNSYMYLGELDDLTTEEQANPKLVSDAYAVKAFRKVPDLKGTTYLRKAYLFGGDMNEGQSF